MVKIDQVKCLVKRVNILTRYFKNSTVAKTWLDKAREEKNILDGGLKTYVKTQICRHNEDHIPADSK